MVKPSSSSGDARGAHLVEFAPGAIIVEQGAPGSEMFIIDDGEVEIVRSRAGIDKVLVTLGPGDFFGEMSVLENRPRSATARAKGACRLLPIDASTLDALLREHPEVAVRMMRKLSGRLRAFEEQEERAGQAALAAMGAQGPMAAMAARAAVSAIADHSPRAVLGAMTTDGAPAARLEHASGWSIALAAGADLVVGRPDPVTGAVPEIDLGALDKEKTLSRRHARFRFHDGRFHLLEEVGTANGTWVGADRLASGVERALADGDTLRFGRLDFVFRLGGA